MSQWFFWPTGIILEINMLNFAFVVNFVPPNASQNFKNVFCEIKNSSINLLIKFMELGPFCHA